MYFATIVAALFVAPAVGLVPRMYDPPTLTGYIHPWNQYGKCMTAVNAVVGGAVTLEDCNNLQRPNIKWNVRAFCDYSPTLFQLDGTNLCAQPVPLPNPGGGPYGGPGITNGSAVQLTTCPQQWPGICYPQQTSWMMIGQLNQFRVMNYNLCLDLTDGKLTNGNKLQVWKCHWEYAPDLKNQRWVMSTTN